MYNQNWGFDPKGTALGGDSSPSAPEDFDLGLGDPMKAFARRSAKLTQQTQRFYGAISDPGGALWDARGNRALTENIADYRTKGFQRPGERELSTSSASMAGGTPVPADFAVRTRIRRNALMDPNSGMSPEGAQQLADTLEQQESPVLDGFHLPNATEPKIANEHGMVTNSGGLPKDFVNPTTGQLYNGMALTLKHMIQSGSPTPQRVDENGVVHKYTPGTGPYDSPGRTLPGGVRGLEPNLMTPAETQASPADALRRINSGAATMVNGSLSVPQGGTGGHGLPGSNDARDMGGSGAGLVMDPTGMTDPATGQPVGGGGTTYEPDRDTTAADYLMQTNAAGAPPSQGVTYYGDDEDKAKPGIPWGIFAGLGLAVVGVGFMISR